VEGLSDTALWIAIIACGVATLGYWAQMVGVRLVFRRLSTEAGEGPTVAAIVSDEDRPGWTEQAGNLGRFAGWATLLLLSLSMIARWQAVDRAPWSNMYEFTIAFAAGVIAFYIVFELVYASESASRSSRMVGGVMYPVALAMLAISWAFFPSDVRPLVPALQNGDLLAIHVAAMVIAYGALSVSFGAAVLYLVQGGERNRFPRLPSAEALDDVAYKSVMLGFPLLAAGIALGAYWANSAWGRYWGWDPKETAALATWLIYGVYLHMRGLRGWSGTRSAVTLVVGFGAVIFTYFVVNLWVSGLHSYAGV
jgi:cytochrome c-type biogenesis protein CcsB